MDEEATTHIALVSIPAFSHQVSILEFAKRLVHLQKDHFHVTCIIPTLGSPNTASKSFFDSLPRNIHCIFLPSVNLDDLKKDSVSLEVQLSLAVSHSMPYIHEALKTLITSTNNLVVLVADAIAHEALQFAKEFNTLSYIYFACSAMLLSLCLHSSKLDETVPCEYRDYPNPIEIPGCISVHGIDLPNSVQDRSSLGYKMYLHRCKQYLEADGILVNSFMGMEEQAFRALSQEGSGSPPVYAIGPITLTEPENDGMVHETHTKWNLKMVDVHKLDGTEPSGKKKGWECLLWLDKQPPNSVLYISFGSGGTLSQEQINELSLGLELSSHRFLWANVRAPNDSASASYLSDDSVDPLDFLPKGFLERTKGRSLVMPCWAPQMEVLGHRSIGAFLTHCGWNSVLESVVKGVPMIAWPLFAEQRTNAAMVTDGLKVAVRPKIGGSNNGIVVKEEIASLIKRLMEGLEGEEIRRRMKELRDAADCAVMEDGSSTKALSKLALEWKSLGRSTKKSEDAKATLNQTKILR